jgi:hypothetical protein
LKIQIYKRGPNNTRTRTDQEYEEEFREYQALLAAQASKVDPKSYYKDGITHRVGLGTVLRSLTILRANTLIVSMVEKY